MLMLQGLSVSDVRKRQEQHGLNIIQVKKKHPWWTMLFSQFVEPLVLILIASAIIAVGLGFYEQNTKALIDGAIIIGIVFLNAGIGFFQEFKTDRALEALKKLVAPIAIVIRDGEKRQIKAENIVPGDLVVLQSGDKIVADGKVLEAASLTVDESAMTGESVPLYKKRDEKLFMGTTVAAGSGLMEVTTIGMNTQFGKIAHLTLETEEDLSPLQKEFGNMGVFVTKLTLGLTVFLIITELFIQKRGILDALLFAVSVAVAAVPEGLPATITIALALGVQTMVKRNAVVKKLSSVETLGSTTVICSDKTGTLTKNEMTVTKLVLGINHEVSVSGSGYDPRFGHIGGKHFSKNQRDMLDKIRFIASTCTEADLRKKDNQYAVLGDPTEVALLTLAYKKIDGDQNYPEVKTIAVLEKIPFDSDRKLMSVVVKDELWTKGSPDELINRCDRVLLDGEIKPFTKELKTIAAKSNEKLASEALRVIGFAYRPLEKVHKLVFPLSALEESMIFLGMAGMIDPPREEVKGSVSFCHMAGIRTIIITGDHGLTAKAVAKQIGMATEKTPMIFGTELDAMTDKKLDEILARTSERVSQRPLASDGSLIFSRVSPEHKRRIVDRLKSLGEVVAVTGDGVNDAPALKRADLGIAMGITGTEVSKETADMILLDDSFASIITAIREGRKIYANLKKFTWFIFSTNIAELVIVFSGIFLKIPPPLTATLILAINVGTDILPAIALGVDHAEPDVMKSPPRDQNVRIMNRSFVTHFFGMGIFMGLVVVGLYIWKLLSFGWNYGEPVSLELASLVSTFAFAAIVTIQVFNSYNARSKTHSVFHLRPLWHLWGANLLAMMMVLGIVYLPALQNVFYTQPLSGKDWVVIGVFGVLTIAVEEIRKRLI